MDGNYDGVPIVGVTRSRRPSRSYRRGVGNGVDVVLNLSRSVSPAVRERARGLRGEHKIEVYGEDPDHFDRQGGGRFVLEAAQAQGLGRRHRQGLDSP